MTTSRRFADRKMDKFERNITKRGAVPETTAKKSKDYPVSPVLLGFFVFVVIGSSSGVDVMPDPPLPDYSDSDKWGNGLEEEGYPETFLGRGREVGVR